MPLPVLTTAEEVRDLVSYLKTKPQARRIAASRFPQAPWHL